MSPRYHSLTTMDNEFSSPPLTYHSLQCPPRPTRRQIPRAVLRRIRCILLFAILLGTLFTLSFIEPISISLRISSWGTFEPVETGLQAINYTQTVTLQPNTAVGQTPDIHLISSHSSIGKVTASFGQSDPTYESAISSHIPHNTQHFYRHFILRSRLVGGLWSKHAYLLAILGLELSKPESERMEWLFWHDRDTVVMNPNIPLDIFLPPEPEFAHVHILVTKDRNGLNNGVFFVRVNQWALKMFASVLSIKEYMPDLQLKYTEQSGMEKVLMRPWWNTSVAYVPQRWFNGFPPSSGSSSSPSSARPGSLLIHFASNRDGLRPERMAHWGNIAQKKATDWYMPFNETGYPAEIAEYWQRLRKGEGMKQVCGDIASKEWKLKQ